MEFISNRGERKHVAVLSHLVNEAQEVILCSGWIDLGGLTLLKPSLASALHRGAAITVFTDARRTPSRCRSLLEKMQRLIHIEVSEKKRLHTKLYYFGYETTYSVIIGSANLTMGGLDLNEEFSTLMHGSIGDTVYHQITDYFQQLTGVSSSS
jgi:HKD family nuclease